MEHNLRFFFFCHCLVPSVLVTCYFYGSWQAHKETRQRKKHSLFSQEGPQRKSNPVFDCVTLAGVRLQQESEETLCYRFPKLHSPIEFFFSPIKKQKQKRTASVILNRMIAINHTIWFFLKKRKLFHDEHFLSKYLLKIVFIREISPNYSGSFWALQAKICKSVKS